MADPLPRDGKVPMVLQLHLLFTNMAPVPIEIRGEVHPASGLVTLDPRPERVTSPVLTNANLIALGVLCSLLFAWHTFFNDDVYEQTRFAQQMIPALLGSLVTFLGLSVGRIKGWLGALVDTLSVLEYPELHFNPALTRRVGTRWFSAGVGIFAVAAAVLVGWHWSVEASTESSKLAIYDTTTRKVVENDRIYRRAMRDDPGRFGLVCVDGEKHPANNPYLLAHLGAGEEGDVWVEVQVRDDEEPAADGPLDEAKDRLQPLTFSQLFDQRDDLVETIEHDLALFFESGDFESARSTVPLETVIALSNTLLAQIEGTKPREKALERSILLRGLWRASAERHGQDADDAQLAGISRSTGELLRRGLGWKTERALFEMLLELQCQYEAVETLHRAAVTPWASMDSKSRYPKLLDYLVAALARDAMKEPQQAFFAEEWAALRRWAWPDGDFGRMLENRGHTRRGGPDPVIDWDQVKQRVETFETRVLFDTSARREEAVDGGSEPDPAPARSP